MSFQPRIDQYYKSTSGKPKINQCMKKEGATTVHHTSNTFSKNGLLINSVSRHSILNKKQSDGMKNCSIPNDTMMDFDVSLPQSSSKRAISLKKRKKNFKEPVKSAKKPLIDINDANDKISIVEDAESSVASNSSNDELYIVSETLKSPKLKNSTINKIDKKNSPPISSSTIPKLLVDNDIKNSLPDENDCLNGQTKKKEGSISASKNDKLSNSPTKNNGLSNSPEDFSNLLNLDNDNATESTSREKPLNTPTKTGQNLSSPSQRYSPQKTDKIDANLVSRAVENLLRAKQGIIPSTKFDLESIYAEKSFEYEYSCTDATIEYDVENIQVPDDKNGNLLMMALVNVFAEPMNCGYFNEEELDIIFSIFTLSAKAKSLLIRILKRKRSWHKVNSIKYPEIATDLNPVFKELVQSKIFDDDIKQEMIPSLLNLLDVEKIRSLCQAMQVNRKGTKPMMINELTKLGNRGNSLFPGIKSPGLVLKGKIVEALGACIRLHENIESLTDRIFVLFVPNQDPREDIVQAFRMLAEVTYGEKKYPPTPKERFPIFRDRSHLICYTEARGALTRIYNASEAKDWDTVCTLGQLAFDRLQDLLKNHINNDVTQLTLPSHVRRFEVNYTWAKVLHKSVEGLKKTKEGIETAAEYLNLLINHRKEYLGNSMRWYSELALIEMHHRKNLEASANITIAGLMEKKLSDIDSAMLADRARKLLGRRKNISSETRQRLIEATQLHQEKILPVSKPFENVIEANMVQGNTTGSKSTWSVSMGGSDVGYVKVEEVAFLHYSGKGFHGGLHCEGALPVTLFATVFWNEIYNIPVPGAFVSPYQDAPLDLYTSHFLDHRHEQVQEKLDFIKNLDHESFGLVMCEEFSKYRDYTSLMHGQLFQNPDDFKDFVTCLGAAGVVGICERLANNYNQWKSGFPDLVIWDIVNKKCKFVEVKGPGDSLSTKQTLWIQFLESLNIAVEVCIVKGKMRR